MQNDNLEFDPFSDDFFSVGLNEKETAAIIEATDVPDSNISNNDDILDDFFDKEPLTTVTSQALTSHQEKIENLSDALREKIGLQTMFANPQAFASKLNELARIGVFARKLRRLADETVIYQFSLAHEGVRLTIAEAAFNRDGIMTMLYFTRELLDVTPTQLTGRFYLINQLLLNMDIGGFGHFEDSIVFISQLPLPVIRLLNSGFAFHFQADEQANIYRVRVQLCQTAPY